MEVVHRLIRQFIPRPPTAEDLAVFTLCLESLPQFEPVRFHLVDRPEIRSFVYPSQEFKSQQWLYIPGTDRWPSESQAVEWAYDVLAGYTVKMFSAYQVPIIFEGSRYITLCAWNGEHIYTSTGQRQRMAVSSDKQLAKHQAQKTPLFHQEIEFMLDWLMASSAKSSHLHLWTGSFLTIAEANEARVLLENIKAVQSNHLFLSAYNTSGSQILMRMAGRILEREPMANISDAQALSSLLPWGSRTLFFHHKIYVGEHELSFNFCYLKPLATFAPIRVEFVASHFAEEDVPNLLDRLLAHFILNPQLIP